MNKWQLEWASIDTRISGLEATVSMLTHAAMLPGLNYEHMLTTSVGIPLINLSNSIRQFLDDYRDALPQQAVAVLTIFVMGLPRNGPELGSWQHAIDVVAKFVGQRAEIAATLQDGEFIGRQKTARAFEHLARSIVVDEGLKARWVAAFRTDETACERLGAVHLLLHGIWAFKVDSIGERTDLVLQERLHISRTVLDVADALVLTEWKLVRNASELPRKAEEGRNQASRYGGSSLAAMELSVTRYVVLVSEHALPMPSDVLEGSRLYRFVNIPISPEPPSVAARRAATRATGPGSS